MSASAQSSGQRSSGPQTGAHAVVADAVDPARRPDVLLRVRRDEGHEPSAWWMIGAFVFVSAAVIALMSFIPGGA
ncbi:UDP-N-acetylmuramyl pentapeptide phosphotransferase [Microbacterium koreense]|uniref:UDP-N-acetylmuramyl pentapeptide phosphotransferase n=1 Tax=Microbacterium koreense TaxID=323761 RepID=A0ABW2ZR11_9MICO